VIVVAQAGAHKEGHPVDVRWEGLYVGVLAAVGDQRRPGLHLVGMDLLVGEDLVIVRLVAGVAA
jgi:hypothetical protein